MLLNVVKRLWLGLALIGLASGLLLLSDLDRRQNARKAPAALPRLAVMQWASTNLLDHTVAGMVKGLRQQGFEAGRTAEIRFLNASGDSAAGNAMAQELASGRYDLVLTASTLALQTVAKANAAGHARHVFGAVTDPYGAGVGITGSGGNQHPPHLVGVGTFQPVERAFRIARRMNPRLRRVGVVWNAGESNSEAQVRTARAVCQELGMELVEANAGNTSEVPEAIRAILARNAEAVWVVGDTVALASLSSIVSAARTAHVPVFTNDPSDTAKGALFGLGASYEQVGIAVGEMAGKILHGASPREFGVENLVPEVLTIHEAMVGELQGWSIPDDIREQARASATPGTPARPWKIRIVRYNDAPFSTDTWRGVMAGFEKLGLQEGRDVNVRCLNAQGDLATLASIMTAVRAEEPDLVMPLSTPALQAALRQTRNLPIVFGCVADGVRAGAGSSETRHLPNVTGITTSSPFAGMARLIRQSVPAVRAVGTLFSPGEVNSEVYREALAAAVKQEGLELVAVPVGSSAETAEASTALLRANIQVICQISDNTVSPGFAQIAKRAREARIPFFCFEASGLRNGATLVLARDYYESGIAVAEVALRVLRGTSPNEIPFTNARGEPLLINPDLMREYGIVLPAELLRKAQTVTGEKP